MKITFEGEKIRDIFEAMEKTLYDADYWKASPAKPVDVLKPQGLTSAEAVAQKAKAYMEEPFIVDKPVAKPVEKRVRTEKQLANDEKMRVAALARVAAKRAAKAAVVTEHSAPEPIQNAPEAQPFAEPEIDPAEMVKLRQKTIEELQAAYANGHQKEVFELLSRFGNGAKSFRELPPESFMPIRKAIDLGALE